ncbi:glucose-6-phosphate isomerase [Sulfuriroseicoccus oceanibius]|uniref:Glucose-6-phosphate isomerase n=1 Tax=Sulfuriroseicoccus oceanibius TaxID=2707525 RepID=A0A6B3L5X1_9BACT|nr:glucose-6-phosphate isomerase [Sulfuriroseicoccus oceanibius]QQL44101.1 glucose-6-phosphate isomerase [Sulfuriroseicoccus oceanibius]
MSTSNWTRFNQHITRYRELGISLDISRMQFETSFFGDMESKIARAYADMDALEGGAIANPDEGRMVGHYWLRNAELAPAEQKAEIERDLADIKAFAADIHNGTITAANGEKFTRVLLIGIGGSALGPQLVSDALTDHEAPMALSFLDNTDPSGIDKVLAGLGDELATTLALVISKSGGTAETRNGMVEAKRAYEAAGLDFAKHATAITGIDSKLDNLAKQEGWIKRFPMGDWVGGRTSVMSVVGLVPAILQGVDIDQFLAGARDVDEKTRQKNTSENLAMKLALMWYHAGNGKGEKDMVVLPYKDSLVLFSKYLQQLVMESLGKEHDLDGKVVNQGVAVYGNKGSTDQHAYVQQLRDGVNNFFVTFIEVHEARQNLGANDEVEPGATTGDFLQGFLRGTRSALSESGRENMTISIPTVNAYYLGSLIALFERAVSFYASLVNINAYHQPGVEAGKKAAGSFLEVLKAARGFLADNAGTDLTATDVAKGIDADVESTYHALVHAAANASGINHTLASTPEEDTFSVEA